MDTPSLAELRKEYRRLQGSINYWNNAARAARKGADQHTGQRQDHDLDRLAEYEKKAIDASQQLEAIKAQLTKLDPNGARARQLNALRSAIGRARREILRFEHLANLAGADIPYVEARLKTRRDKLQQLTRALLNHHSDTAARLAHQQRQEDDFLAIATAPYHYNPFDPSELEKLDARQAGRLVDTDLTEPDRHQPVKPRRTTH